MPAIPTPRLIGPIAFALNAAASARAAAHFGRKVSKQARIPTPSPNT